MNKGKSTVKKPGKSSGRAIKKSPGGQNSDDAATGGELTEQAATAASEEKEDQDYSKSPPLVLEKTVIAMPLFNRFEERAKKLKDETEQAEKDRKEGKTVKPPPPEPVYPVIIDVNLLYYAGREEAKNRVRQLIVQILKDVNVPRRAKEAQGINVSNTKYSQQYVFAVLEEEVIKELVRRDGGNTPHGKELPPTHLAIYHIWPDFEIKKLTTKSLSTVKADAARNAFAALGEDMVWAVMDSGIDGTHPHFKKHKNLELPPKPDPLHHRDFTVLSGQLSAGDDLSKDGNEDVSKDIDMEVGWNEKPLEDVFGHGTHVAGIIGGELEASDGQVITATTFYRNENKDVKRKDINIEPTISGMAPKCKLVSLKVLNDKGGGLASNLIAAIEWIQEINGNGRRLRIHGVNMSVGYEFEPEWFACGQSPLCVEVNRLVKSGVVVVVAAGNTGYGFVQAKGKKTSVTAGLDLTINDPGNSDLAITVGSTHKEMPHIYGVSYFSSKGPTGDGRLKPDLVAPGEKIISCDSAQRRAIDPQVNNAPPPPPATAVNETPAVAAADDAAKPPAPPMPGFYREDSGTSMAAPHVSGVIAAFLSVRREFIGQPETVKEIFLSAATDLKRERYFQGHGLVDLMRAIQSV